MFEFLAFIIGIIIMAPIVYIFFSLQELKKRIETIENTKFKDKYYANENGLNSRLDEIQSTILNIKLKQTNKDINKRRNLAKRYIRALSNTSLKLPIENFDCDHVYHLFTVFHPKASVIKKKLLNLKIETRTIYPYPIHKMKAYSNLIKNKYKLKNSEIKSKGIFSLPLYPELKNSEVDIICDKLKIMLKKI